MDPEVLSHYYVLGVEHDARNVQIKLEFHRQCLKWHPDKNPNASVQRLALCNAMMQKLNDAYTCLRDPDTRKTYELRCASIVFTHEDDPGNHFRRQFEAERRAREEAAQRRRTEERERNAARQKERQDQERRQREAEDRERQRREAEERERERRAEQERQAREERKRAEREQEEQERRRRDREEQERERKEREQNQRRRGTQEHQSRTDGPNRYMNPDFTDTEWENLFNILRILIKLHELAGASGNSQPRPGSSSIPSGGSTASSYGASRPSAPNPQPEASQFKQEQTNDDFEASSTASPNPSTWKKRSSEFGPIPKHSSRARWSDAELQALLKLRKDYPFEKWDTIASRLNAMFENGRNGNAVRQKHSKSTT